MTTRDKIIKTALEFFISNSYEATSLKDVAAEVGISKPAIYHHFSSKDELFMEAVNAFLNELDSIFSKMTSLEGELKSNLKSTLTSLEGLISHYHNYINVEKDMVLLRFYFFIYDAIKSFPEIRKKFNDLYTKTMYSLKDLLRKSQDKGVIRDDIDCETLSFQINAMIEGTFLLSILDPQMALDRVGKKIFENLWTMIKKV